MGLGNCNGKCDLLNLPKLPRVRVGTKYQFYNYCNTCTRWWDKEKFNNPKQCPCCKCKIANKARCVSS